MESLYNTFRIKLSLVPMRYFRSFHEQINWGSRLICIMGQKGVGKSTLILQHIKQNNNLSETLYVTADNMYFAGVDSSAWCLYRMNLKTQEISEVFKLDKKSNRNYTKLAGYDGQYFYVFDKPDLSKGKKNITTDDKNIVYIVDTNGEIKDTLEFNKDSTKMTASFV